MGRFSGFWCHPPPPFPSRPTNGVNLGYGEKGERDSPSALDFRWSIPTLLGMQDAVPYRVRSVTLRRFCESRKEVAPARPNVRGLQPSRCARRQGSDQRLGWEWQLCRLRRKRTRNMLNILLPQSGKEALHPFRSDIYSPALSIRVRASQRQPLFSGLGLPSRR